MVISEVKRRRERPFILYETGPDESFLLGTREELVAFAQKILQSLDEPMMENSYQEIPFQMANVALNDSLGDATIDNLFVVASIEDKHKLVNKIRVNNGLLPIDWEKL